MRVTDIVIGYGGGNAIIVSASEDRTCKVCSLISQEIGDWSVVLNYMHLNEEIETLNVMSLAPPNLSIYRLFISKLCFWIGNFEARSIPNQCEINGEGYVDAFA